MPAPVVLHGVVPVLSFDAEQRLSDAHWNRRAG
jgi:hypothetical protein